MSSPIAIVGLACIYPDARTPGELWENVLAQRRAFRRLPDERLRREDYWSADPAAPDRTYAAEGAVIEGYEFDRVGFRVAGSTFRSADLAHWLALDVASKALSDAGFSEGRGLPRETTGVLLGNTLTGEFSRANTMRLRWPYVRRVVESALDKLKLELEPRAEFLERLEAEYKSPFPAVGEESLAGGLSNTIAGRICNQYDLRGGGYTVDGACASSLLAVANACTALRGGDLDVVLAGGVDLSLDPFELVGFAKTGALAPEEMRIFDRRSAGFWPGEGCGFVVLMRHEDALAQGGRVYAVIRGWGISSDGSGGITRPEAQGQLEALRRAYRRAGFGIDSVAFCEGHGTGTAVGDATELAVLSRARHEAKPGAAPAAIGSIKANIGHTKAAAGVAGLKKAAMAVHTEVLPPTTGCGQPHAQLLAPGAPLRVLREAELWPDTSPPRASVSAMGFGGINAHLVIESPVFGRRAALSAREHALSRSHQDAELFLLAAPTLEELQRQTTRVLGLAGRISRAEMADLAAHLQRNLEAATGEATPASLVRAAVVASRPAELAERLQMLMGWFSDETSNGPSSKSGARLPKSRHSQGVSLGAGQTAPRLAYLFPGQGSPMHLDGGLWYRRFDSVRALYDEAALPDSGDSLSTRVMQPAIVTASLAGLRVLEQFGVAAEAAIGHSLGELVAAHWAEAMSEEALLRIARVRGAAMAELGAPTGAMLAIAAPWPQVQAMLDKSLLEIVGFNSPRQTVVAGEAAAIAALAQRATAAGWQATRLPVSHAFHTPLVAAATPALAEQLACENLAPLRSPIFSTITGAPLDRQADLRTLFCVQMTSPVRFADALAGLLGLERSGERFGRGLASSVPPPDLLIEVGPGSVLAGLVRDSTRVPVLSLDAGGPSLAGLLEVLAATFALGAPLKLSALYSDRFTRSFDLDWSPKFFVNPCELAPVSKACQVPSVICQVPGVERHGPGIVPLPATEQLSRSTQHATRNTLQAAAHLPAQQPESASSSPIQLVRELVAARAELPITSIQDGHRLLSDLHLNSITVGQLIGEAARRCGLPRLAGPTDFANATVGEVAAALEEVNRSGQTGPATEDRRPPPGVDLWFETFTTQWEEAKLPDATRITHHASPLSGWQIFAPQAHPLASALRRKFAAADGNGVLLCLPEQPNEEHLGLLLEAAGALRQLKAHPRFVLVQYGWGGGGFARTLHLETPGLITCVVNLPPRHPKAAEWVLVEARAATAYTEARYDERGRRFEPRLGWAPHPSDPSGRSGPSDKRREGHSWPIGSQDVLMVTGGAQGIAAECALALGRATGARLALLGRSEVGEEISRHLARLAAAGVRCCYVRADVTDRLEVQQAVAEAQHQLGPITALLHAAGSNTPQLIETLQLEAFRRTLAPKVQGLRNVLGALDSDNLKLLITFGSLIARAGLRGEADYATANEWQTALTERFQTEHPRCRCLALEWSVWSGLGMGARLGRVESLIQQGIIPIPPDEGVRILLEAVRRGAWSVGAKSVKAGYAPRSHAPRSTLHAPVALVVTGRFGQPPTLKFQEPELPLRRFLERKRVYYPGVELVIDADLSAQSDLYLEDHQLQKQRLLPAVMGLEAMAQAAMALLGSKVPPDFEKVELARPVAVSDQAPARIRLAALRRGHDLIEVCLRAEETDYQVDHFRALCRFESPKSERSSKFKVQSSKFNAPGDPATADHPSRVTHHASRITPLTHLPPLLALDPHQHLYGRILFHGARFRRLQAYRWLTAKECVAEINAAPVGVQASACPAWFGPYLPTDFVLGDPAARDAALHAIQACIPHHRILPTGIDRVLFRRTEAGPRVVHAKERQRQGNKFIYDLEVLDGAGELLERWEGLHLQAVEALQAPESWPLALLAPYLGRRLEELVGDSSVRILLEKGGRPGSSDGSGQSDNATRNTQHATRIAPCPSPTDPILQRALGHSAPISRRSDGKPVTAPDQSISAAHSHDLTLAIAGSARVACDLESVAARTDLAWQDLLGSDRKTLAARISRERSEGADHTHARLWTVLECLKKAGLSGEAPLVLESTTADGWVLLRSGTLAIATCVATVGGLKTPVAFALAVDVPK